MLPARSERADSPAWRYDPAGTGLLRWWDGRSWTAVTREPSAVSPAPPALPAFPVRDAAWNPAGAARPPARLARWLVSPAARPGFLAVAAISASGWAAAAGLGIFVSVTGHPLAAAGPVLREPVFLLLSIVDMVLAWSWRSLQPRPAPNPRPLARQAARANRKQARAALRAARRDRARAGGRPHARLPAGAILARIWRPRFPELPRPAGRAISAAGSVTLCAAAWVYLWPAAHGQLPFPVLTSGPNLASQQWGAAMWMVQCYAWSRLACARLNNDRASARLWMPPPEA
jgi:hypothetical protein